jgi:MFS family permease
LLFKKPVRRDVLIGTGLAVVATFGYQGAIQWVPSWIAAMLHAQGSREVIPQVSLVTTTLTTGGIIGCLCLPYVADRWGRRHALFIYFLGALLSVPTTFLLARELSHAVIATPIMGFFAAGVTTGFAIYFPELFPTAIRATAGVLTSAHGSFAPAIATIGSVYFIGLIILIFARETKGQALPA